MRARLIFACLYTAVLSGATPALALSPEARVIVEAARAGAMTRLTVHEAPREAVSVAFRDAQGREVNVAEWAGKVVLLNFWATWCPPCLKEMPSLDRLSAAMAGDDFEVIAVSTDRGDAAKPARWLAENGIALPLFHDPRLKLAQASALLGQPTTLILDRQGREIARFTGETEWDAPEAQALLRAVIAATAPDA